jgi:hypothetical protein
VALVIELRSVPDCPNLPAVRDLVHQCVAAAGLPPAAVVERVGAFRSPSVLVNGQDVTGAALDGPAACVLVLPTAEQIDAALHAATA